VPRQRPEARSAEPGRRVSVRRVRPDGERGDLVGYVLAADADRLVLRDRHGVVHDLAWADVVAWRTVGVARGRDPLRTPREELDRLALPGTDGRVFVARLGDLLDDRPAVPLGAADEQPPAPAVLAGEWVSAGAADDVLALARWAAHHDARSLQVRTSDPSAVDRLLSLGFTERE